MNVDLADTLARLGRRAEAVISPAIADPDLAKDAFILGHALGLIGRAVDEAPGRLHRQITDAQDIIGSYDGHSTAPRYAALLREPCDQQRLSGLSARANRLNAALIAIDDELDASDEIWAVALRRRIRAAYLEWTQGWRQDP